MIKMIQQRMKSSGFRGNPERYGQKEWIYGSDFIVYSNV